jgi:hypothetical protein
MMKEKDVVKANHCVLRKTGGGLRIHSDDSLPMN